MKKVILVSVVLLAVAGMAASCKKCTTCTAKHNTSGIIQTSDDFCGTSDEVKEFQNDWATTYPTSLGYETSCSSK